MRVVDLLHQIGHTADERRRLHHDDFDLTRGHLAADVFEPPARPRRGSSR